MTSVYELLTLSIGYAPARAALREIVKSTMENGTYSTVQLHVGIGPATLRKSVLVDFEPDAEGTRFDEVWRIRWSPENGGPYPDFSGLLSVQYADNGSAQLEIRGEYSPPFGALGKGFDLVVGQRIASQTCKNLLAEIGERIQKRCAA